MSFKSVMAFTVCSNPVIDCISSLSKSLPSAKTHKGSRVIGWGRWFVSSRTVSKLEDICVTKCVSFPRMLGFKVAVMVFFFRSLESPWARHLTWRVCLGKKATALTVVILIVESWFLWKFSKSAAYWISWIRTSSGNLRQAKFISSL